jgi:hypothetical protein
MGHDTYRLHHKLIEPTVLSYEKTHDCVSQESQKQCFIEVEKKVIKYFKNNRPSCQQVGKFTLL